MTIWSQTSARNLNFLNYTVPNLIISPIIFRTTSTGFLDGSDSKESACNAGDPGLISGSGRSPGEGNGCPFQNSCLGNFTDRGAYSPLGHKRSDMTERLTLTSCNFVLLITMQPFRRRQWHPTPVLLPGKSHGWRSLVGCSPWGRWESDTTERLHVHFSLSCTGERNGNLLQCSCLENPRDGGAWWAARRLWGRTESDTTEAT